MIKKIELKLSQIKYKGKSIGDDIQAKIQVLDQFLFIKKKIKVDTTKKFNDKIGTFITDKSYFEAKVNITIIEEDIIFNDIANTIKTIKVDTNSTKPQKFTYTLELRENRYLKNWGNSTAVFEVTIEATTKEAVQYIPDVDNGWLLVRILNEKQISLPSFLKVKSLYFKSNREYFEILEGHYRGKTASVKMKSGKSHLISNVKHESPVHFKYSISKKKLITGRNKKDEYNATDHNNSPWKKGSYDIEMPDYPHTGGTSYEDKAKRAKTWFRIGHKGEKYLHVGRASLGCITITDIKKWDKIYDKLIKARKGDSISVGVLEVVD